MPATLLRLKPIDAKASQNPSGFVGFLVERLQWQSQVLPQVSRSSKDMLTAGQNASAPSLLESLLTGPPTFWNQLLLADLVLSHMDDLDGCWEAMAALAVCLGDRVGGVI